MNCSYGVRLTQKQGEKLVKLLDTPKLNRTNARSGRYLEVEGALSS